MKIAVCSKDFQKVSGHAGQARHWLVFEIGKDHAPGEPEKVGLEKGQTFHHFKDDGPHPLDGIDVLLAASSGESFIKRMKKRGVAACMTRETDPRQAVNDYVHRQLKPPKPRPIMGLICKVRDRFSEHGD